MREVFILGAGCTPFGRHLDTSISALAAESVEAAISDAGSELEGAAIESVWFGSAFADRWGQANIRGQAVLAPLVERGTLPLRIPITNVEGACATGSFALRGAVNEIRACDVDVAMAVGVEKMHLPGAATDIFDALAGCAENLDGDRLERTYRNVAADAGRDWLAERGKSLFLETYAVQAQLHMNAYDVTPEQVAIASAKTHCYASQNPLAQYRFEMSPADVLSDRAITHPFTRAMCAPITDGAAAVIVCSRDWLARQPRRVRERAVTVRGIGVATGSYGRTAHDPSVSRFAAHRAYAQAQSGPGEIDVVEVHDATSYAEIFQLEMLELCSPGEGAKLAESGETGPGGALPVNTSGGLVAKGHPVGATGLSMIYELTAQLRGEAGSRQADGARIGLAENGGGVLGLEEATCVVTILEGAR